MKKMFFIIIMISGIANAYCEYGIKQNERNVQGGYYVTYRFNSGKSVGIKYSYNEIIPFSINFDFYSMEMCR